MTRIIKHSANLLLYLVNDMLDIYMLKNGKFQRISETFAINEMLGQIFDMFEL
jgi:signal transduction histidine kinase